MYPIDSKSMKSGKVTVYTHPTFRAQEERKSEIVFLFGHCTILAMLANKRDCLCNPYNCKTVDLWADAISYAITWRLFIRVKEDVAFTLHEYFTVLGLPTLGSDYGLFL